MRKWLAVPLLAVGLWFVGGSLPALAASPTDTGGEQESLRDILGRNVCLVDNFAFVWNLNISRTGGPPLTTSISGTVDAVDEFGVFACTYSVSGSSSGASFNMTASNPIPPEPCCGSFTYTGVVDKPSRTAAGTWSNVCDFAGFFTMGLC